jgi:hypothetical protein
MFVAISSPFRITSLRPSGWTTPATVGGSREPEGQQYGPPPDSRSACSPPWRCSACCSRTVGQEGDSPGLRILLVLVCSLLTVAASAQVSKQRVLLPCDAFVRNANGCWSPTREVTINASTWNGSVGPGTLFMGVNLPELLNSNALFGPLH